MKHIQDSFTLHGKVNIPCVGLGTWQSPDGEAVATAVEAAIKAGYRHIDTAAVYENEKGVGTGIRNAGIPREEIFVTSKLWNSERGYDKTMRAFEQSLDDLGLDHLDLYLIHWPAIARQFDNWEQINKDTWRAFIDLYKAGRIRAIGVSNFQPKHLNALMDMEIIPSINQIEYHPGVMQQETVDFCNKNGILIEAWSPLGTGKMLNNQTLLGIAAKYNKSVAQLCIRWCLQHNTLPLPKSITPSRIVENANVFDFSIDDADMQTIDAMGFCGGSGHDSDNIDF